MYIIITNNIDSFSLDKNNSISLELKLNVSTKSRVLKHIGDILYEYGTGNTDGSRIIVNSLDFNFLKMLNDKKTWQECRGL